MFWRVSSLLNADCGLPIESLTFLIRIPKSEIIPVPSLLSDSPYSSSHSDATNLSSLPKSLSAESLELRQTDRRARLDREATVRRGRVDETFVLTVCREEFVAAPCR